MEPTFATEYSVYLSGNQSIEDVGLALGTLFPGAFITTHQNTVEMNLSGWKLFIRLASDSWVAEEAAEIAQEADPHLKGRLQRSTRRLELCSSSDDPDKHYNAKLIAYEALSYMDGAVGFNSATGDLLANSTSG